MIWFKANDLFKFKGKEVFVGPCPFKYDKKDYKELIKEELLITHVSARQDCTYRILGIESFAIQIINKGTPIGFMVELIKGEEE